MISFRIILALANNNKQLYEPKFCLFVFPSYELREFMCDVADTVNAVTVSK